MEYSNETWNTYMPSCGYCQRCGQLRYDASGGTTTPFTESNADINSFSVIRSIVMCQDLATAFPTEIASGRLIRVACGQGTYGIAVGGTGVNEDRVWANAKVLADPWNVGGTNAYAKFEAFAWASYFDATTGSDYQFYVDHWDEYTANWLAAVGPAAKEAVCRDWVELGVRPAGEGTARYGNVVAAQFDTVLGNLGRTAVMYEGGYDWHQVGSPPDRYAFLNAVARSIAWAAEQKTFHEKWNTLTHSMHPALYFQDATDQWGYHMPYFDPWLGGVEGAALNLAWNAVAEYNDAVDGDEPEPPPSTTVIARPRVRMR